MSAKRTYRGYTIELRAVPAPQPEGAVAWMAVPGMISKPVDGKLLCTPVPHVRGLFPSRQEAEQALLRTAKRLIDLGEVGF